MLNLDDSAPRIQLGSQIEHLLFQAAAWPSLSGATTQAEILGKLDGEVKFEDVTAPEFVEGGESVTISARVMQRTPGGTLTPAAGAEVRLWASTSLEQEMSAIAESDGTVEFTVTHAVPDPNFDGVHRYTGFHDLTLFLATHATFSHVITAEHEQIVRGRIAIKLTSAHFDDDSTDALAGTVVLVPTSPVRAVNIDFLVTKGGQPLQGHAVTATLTGAGTIDPAESTYTDGHVSVLYIPEPGSSGTAYVAPQVAHADGQVVAGRADIQLS